VLQGVVLFIGSIIFLVVQKTELGGLPAAALFYRNPANGAAPNVSLMQNIPPASTIVAYWDFVFKVSVGGVGCCVSIYSQCLLLLLLVSAS
jgi:hypothetical protein